MFMKRIFAMTLALSGLLLVVVAGSAPASAQGADDPAQVAQGQVVFELSCAGCHGDDGAGITGAGRSLTGIANQGDRAVHIDSITTGKGGMPAFGERLSSDEIEQAASYVRLTFVDEAAATADEELARTGAGSAGLAVVGVTMVTGGMYLVTWNRRRTGM